MPFGGNGDGVSYGGSSQGAIAAGSYSIVPSGLTSANYTISYTNGTLTITEPSSPTEAPSLSALAFASNQFQFLLTGTAGSNYVVQATTNLSLPIWVSLVTNAAPFIFTDTNVATFNQRFYRGQVAP